MWRRVAAWVFLVLMAIAVAGSVIGFWVHRTLLDTDAFMSSVAPIVESEPVQEVVADRVADQLLEALDLEARLEERLSQAEARLADRLGEALELPDAIVQRLENARLGLDSLAPMIAAGVETRVRDAVTRVVSSPEGAALLLQTIEVAHERTVLLLRDEMDQLPNVVVADGEVRLNLVPVLAQVLRSVVNAGLDVIGIDREIPPFDSSEDASAAVARLAGVVGTELPPDFGQVRLTSEATLERAQGLVRAFDLALWALLIAAVLFAVGAIWLAPTLSAGLVRIGIATTLAVGVAWVLVQVISGQVSEAATTADGRVAVGDLVNALVSSLTSMTLVIAVIGIAVVIVGFFADFLGEPAATLVTTGGDAPASIAPPVPPEAVEAEVPPAPPAPAASAARVTTEAAVSQPASARKPPAKPASAKASPAKPKPASAKASSAKAPPAKPASAKGTPGKPATTPTTRRRRRPPAAGA